MWRPQEKWSAVYNVRTILLSIQSLLGDPNLDSPLNGHAASIWHNVQEYKKALLKHKSAHGTEAQNHPERQKRTNASTGQDVEHRTEKAHDCSFRRDRSIPALAN